MKKLTGSIKIIGWVSLALMLVFTTSSLACDRQASNGVRVTVQPKALSQDQAAVFEVRLNTHNVELRQDLAAVSELRDAHGRSYRPSSWDGSPPGGHHRSGTLIFPNLKSPVKSVTLIIRDVASVPERTFSWEVQP